MSGFVLPSQGVEKIRQRRSLPRARRFAQAGRTPQPLNVRPGQTPVRTGDGRAGEKSLRFTSSLVAALLNSLFEHPASVI
jgi:hypothetical protein